jgi:hypothetical protein
MIDNKKPLAGLDGSVVDAFDWLVFHFVIVLELHDLTDLSDCTSFRAATLYLSFDPSIIPAFDYRIPAVLFIVGESELFDSGNEV